MKFTILSCLGLLTFLGSPCVAEPSFDIGTKDFRPGDSIRITHVQRGDTFPTVSADYELASEAEAKVSLFITSPRDSGRVPVAPTQSKTIRKGSGTVILHHPDVYEGMPHVSFYPAKGGHVFGGVYFSPSAASTASHEPPASPEADPAFTLGNSAFRPGDSIRILSVKRSADLLTVTAEYTLASQAKADLHLYVPSTEKSPAFDSRQATVVSKGNGRITLHHPNPPIGQPHLTFYDPQSHRAVGGLYFGTAEEAAESKRYSLDHMVR